MRSRSRITGLKCGAYILRTNRNRRSGPGFADEPRAPVTLREASDAPDLDSPATGEFGRHVIDHPVHRERDVALDKVGLPARNPFDVLRLRHRCVVASSMLARLCLAGCRYWNAIARAIAAPTRSATASISLSARWRIADPRISW